jgi:HTH-type transcriptional regulator/antitoxin HigA
MYRRSKAFASDPGAVAAWLRIGEIAAADLDCEEFDRAQFTGVVSEARALTREMDPRVWFPRLVDMCSAAGVAIVLKPELKGARINGAARWLTPNKALIQLSLRHRWSDILWFTFFHEAAHLVLHSKRETFINDTGQHSGVEQEADAFAAETLIPRRFEADLSTIETTLDAEEFASRVGISAGIVVGRLQHEGRWPFSAGNSLKQRLVFSTAATG